jgi:ABC-type lipoprotein release transport system permease subunit
LFLASETLSTSSALEVPGILSALETDVNKLFPNSLFLTTLSSTLSEFQRRLVLAQVPIYLFSALVAAVLLYYLWVVSDLLARSRGQEAAMLRSRGASLSQTAAVMGGLEGVLIALPAVVLGPLLAYLLVRFPLKDALFSGPVSQVLPSISLGAYGMSALIGLLSVSVLIGSGLLVARGNLIEHLRERSRPPATLAMHRYYVDLFVLVVLGLFWWELRDRGGFITQRVLGEGVDVSPLTLLGPVLGLFAAALVLLRVFPLAMRILVRAAEPAGPPWLLHGLRRVARNANLYGALALLLTLSIALGIFGSAFSATLLDARASQVRYQVGGEVVAKVQLPIGASTLVSAQELLTSVDGVSAATPLLRTQGSLVKGAPSSNVNLLALEPASLPETAWFRRDFASASLADLVEPLQTPVAPNAGVPIPGDATSISVWAKPKERYVGLNLWVQIADARSQARNIFIGELDYTDWRLLGGVLPQETSLEAPFRVLGFFMTTGLRGNIGAGSVLLDGLTATTASGVQREVDTLDRVASWIPYAHPGTVEDTVTAVGASRARTGGALEFTWASPVVTGVRGIMQPVVPLPIPAVGGPTLNTGDRLLLHINQAYVPVEITSTVSYFPTVDPRRGGMVLVNLEHYLRYTDSLPFGNSGLPNELWFALDPGADRPATIERLRQMLPGFTTMTDREEEVAKAQRDPLTSGGWRSLVFLGLLALGGTAILGFTLFAALTVRSGRTELAVLETVGFSHGNVLVLIALEFLTVAAVGTAAGAAIGLWVGRWSLGYLSTQGITKASLPPAALALDPGLSTLALAGAGVAAVIATLFALLTAWSLSPGAVLREDA